MPAGRGKVVLLSGVTIDEDLDLGAYGILTTDLSFLQLNSTYWHFRNRLNTAYRNLRFASMIFHGSLIGGDTTTSIGTRDLDTAILQLQARDTGVGKVNVARLVGAADPYLEHTLPSRMMPGAVPGAVLEGMFGYNAITDRMWYQDAGATRILGLGAWKQGTFTNDTSDGDQTITGVGFQPELLIVWCLAKAYSLAITDATNLTSLLGMTTTPVFDLVYLAKPYTDGSNFIVGKLKQFDADGFTITWENLAGTAPARTYAYLAWRA